MKVDYPILRSMLDEDLYKITMGQVVFHHFPRVRVSYVFTNRGKTPFPEGFAAELQNQLHLMAKLRMTKEEKQYLHTIKFLRPTYIEWLYNYQFDPSEVSVIQNGDQLHIYIEGYWFRTIFWEVRLMALISELYFILTGQVLPNYDDFEARTDKKGEILAKYGCQFMDFGTRRRYSYESQDGAVRRLHAYRGFLGTSNVHLAMKYNVKAHGTYAHECIMAMSAKYGVRGANLVWMKLWAEHFEGNLGTALTDTYTTGLFLKDFGTYEARLFDGVRHDSGSPYQWGDYKILPHYTKLGIDYSQKRLVFSDNLKVAEVDQLMVGKSWNFVPLAVKYQNIAKPIGGIGTFFTNDCGVTPLNMVIKVNTVDFGEGPRQVVKISDEEGKYTGDPKTVQRALEEINL